MRPGNGQIPGDHRTDSPSDGLVSRARERLEQHPHFRGRAGVLGMEMAGETIVLTGCLPSHYLKQLLQEALKALPGLVNIDNQVHVMWPGS